MKTQRGLIATAWLYLIAGVAVLAMLSGIAYKIRESGKDTVRLEWAAASQAQRDAETKRATEAATKLETSNAKARIVYRTITKSVDKVVERDVYRINCFDADGLRLANDALRGESTNPAQPDKPVPKS